MRKLIDVPRILPADGDYPNGRIGNSLPAQGGNPAVVGTAIVEELQGDFYQLLQKLIIDAGVVPNDLPDNVSNGYQLLEAFNAKILQTALASSLISRTAFDNVFTKLNTGSIGSILFDNNPSAIVRIGDAQTAIFDLDNISLVINGIMRDGSIDVPVGTRVTVTFKNVAVGTSLRITPSAFSGFVFNFDGLSSILPLVAGLDNTFTFKFLGVDPAQSSKKVILVESAPGYALSQLNGKADASDVILKGGGDAYDPAADTDPVNLGNVKTLIDRISSGVLTAGVGINLIFSSAYRYGAFVHFTMRYSIASGAVADKVVATLNSSVPVAESRWEFTAGNRGTDTKEINTLYVAQGSREIRLYEAGDSGVEFTMSGFYPVNLDFVP